MKKFTAAVLGAAMTASALLTTAAPAAAAPVDAVLGAASGTLQGVLGALDFGSTSPGPATTVTVKQGAEIEPSRCTLSYIDNARHRAYTAAHCVKSEPHGAVIYADGTAIGTLGRITYLNSGTDYARVVDTAEINLYPGVRGVNVHSGDQVIPFEEIKPGERVCVAGNGHRHGARTEPVTCGTIQSAPKYRIVAQGMRGGGGDSGGAAWIPGRGYIGVSTAASKDIMYINAITSPHNVYTFN